MAEPGARKEKQSGGKGDGTTLMPGEQLAAGNHKGLLSMQWQSGRVSP